MSPMDPQKVKNINCSTYYHRNVSNSAGNSPSSPYGISRIEFEAHLQLRTPGTVTRRLWEVITYVNVYQQDMACTLTTVGIYVVVQFIPWFKFYFPSFLDMLMHDNEIERKEKKI